MTFTLSKRASGRPVIVGQWPTGGVSAWRFLKRNPRYVQERGFSREQAYVICSVAVDLRVSNVVDVPNYVVSALLPETIFDGD